MSVAAPAAVSASAPSRRRVELAYTASLLLGEAILLIILAKLVPRIVAYDAGETLSVWAVAGALGLGFLVSRWLGSRELSMKARFWWGLIITLVALQIIGSADLSESARIWNMSWLLELGKPSSAVWREVVVLEDGTTHAWRDRPALCGLDADSDLVPRRRAGLGRPDGTRIQQLRRRWIDLARPCVGAGRQRRRGRSRPRSWHPLGRRWAADRRAEDGRQLRPGPESGVRPNGRFGRGHLGGDGDRCGALPADRHRRRWVDRRFRESSSRCWTRLVWRSARSLR